VSNATRSQEVAPVRDAASLIFNLPEYAVIDAVDLPSGGRRVIVQAVDRDDACPDCGVVSARVHQWTRQRVHDMPAGGEPVQVIVNKPRMLCTEAACGRRTFVQATDQLPFRARCLTRLREQLVDAVIDSGRAVDEVAASFGVAWWTVQSAINATAVTLPDPDTIRVRNLGIDEHRFARARFFRDEDTGGWRRVEPWMSTFVNADTGQVLGVVDGRGSAGIRDWLEDRSDAWRARVGVVAIDPSASFRSAIEHALPDASVSVDHWHLIRLANLTLTRVRQRVAREQLGHRGRRDDLTWAHRMLLLRAGDRLSRRAQHRLERVLRVDDPTGEIGAAWGVKERLRMLLACTDLESAHEARMQLGLAVLGADMPETTRLWDTINAWWQEIETFIDTRVTNARTEAANTSIKQIKRTGRGYRNPDHYQTRILLRSARRTRRRRTLNQQATTFNCG
jgi:transposase